MDRIDELIKRRPNRWGNLTIKEFERDIAILQRSLMVAKLGLEQIADHKNTLYAAIANKALEEVKK